MEKEDGLPQYGCLCCVQKLESVVTFMKQCEDSDRVLRKNLDTDYFKHDKTIISGDIIQDLKSFSLDYSSDDQKQISEAESKNRYSDANNGDFAYDSMDDVPNKRVKNTRGRKKKVSKKVKKDSNTKKNITNKKDTEKKDVNDSEIDEYWLEFNVKPTSDKNTEIPSGELCHYCGKEFLPGKRNAYRNHIENYHSEKKFKCDKCHRAFYTQLRLDGHHFNYHQKEGKRFACDMCDLKFEAKKRLIAHRESIHLKSITYECDKCSKVFYNKSYFQVHQKRHTTEGERKCTLCNKVFSSKTMLNNHRRSHTGERPYACRFCDSKFTMRQSLREHERLHTGEKPFKCPACQKGFSQNGNMKSHFKYNHRKLDFKETRAAFRLSLKKDKEMDEVSNDATVLEIEYTNGES